MSLILISESPVGSVAIVLVRPFGVKNGIYLSYSDVKRLVEGKGASHGPKSRDPLSRSWSWVLCPGVSAYSWVPWLGWGMCSTFLLPCDLVVLESRTLNDLAATQRLGHPGLLWSVSCGQACGGLLRGQHRSPKLV